MLKHILHWHIYIHLMSKQEKLNIKLKFRFSEQNEWLIDKSIYKHIKIIHSNENSLDYLSYIQHLILNIDLRCALQYYCIVLNIPHDVIACSISIQLTRLKKERERKKPSITSIFLICEELNVFFYNFQLIYLKDKSLKLFLKL